MPVSAKFFGPGLQAMLAGTIVWGTDTIVCTLHSSSLTPAQDTMDFFSDVSSTELATAGGYTAGGATLASKTNNYTAASNTAWLDAADVSWTASGSGFTARYAVIWKDTGTDSTSPVIGYIDFGADQALTTAGWVLTLQFDATTGVACAIAA